MDERQGGKFSEPPAEDWIDPGALCLPVEDTRVALAAGVWVEADWDDLPFRGNLYAGVALARVSAFAVYAGETCVLGGI